MKKQLKTAVRALLLVAALFVTHSAAAFYDASLGRWINRDPIGEKGGLNLFGFVRNEPVGSYDAFGLAQASGVKVCREPGIGYHEWIEYEGGSVGFYPGPDGIWPGGTGRINDPDPHVSDSNKICKEVHIPDCTDKDCFQKCVKNLKNSPSGFYCVIGENCRGWNFDSINNCTKKCSKGAK